MNAVININRVKEKIRDTNILSTFDNLILLVARNAKLITNIRIIIKFEISLDTNVVIKNIDISNLMKLSLIFTFLFGTGFSSIYYESFIFRILFGTGLVGFFLLILLCFRLNIFIIFFLFITGITLDFTSSFKQFIILYFFFQYMRSYNKNEISN